MLHPMRIDRPFTLFALCVALMLGNWPAFAQTSRSSPTGIWDKSWFHDREEICQTILAWAGQDALDWQAELFERERIYAPDRIHLLLDENFVPFFSKRYQQLSKDERYFIQRGLESCAGKGRLLGVVFLTSSSVTRTAGYLNAMDRVEKVFTADMRSKIQTAYQQELADIALAEAQRKEQEKIIASTALPDNTVPGQSYHLHDQGSMLKRGPSYTIFEEIRETQGYIRTRENCAQYLGVNIALNEDANFVVTRELMYDLYQSEAISAIRGMCGGNLPKLIRVSIYIAGLYIKDKGYVKPKSYFIDNENDSPVATAFFERDSSYSGPQDVDIRYPSVHLADQYQKYYKSVGSISGRKAYHENGRRTRIEVAYAEERRAFREANPPWPKASGGAKVDAQHAYIVDGNFKGLTGHILDEQIEYVTSYLDAYWDKCIPAHGGKTVQMAGVRTVTTGQTTDYVMAGRNSVIGYTRTKSEEVPIIFIELRQKDTPAFNRIVEKIGPRAWGVYRGAWFSDIRDAQKSRIDSLGCDTSRMHAYEQKLFTFLNAILELEDHPFSQN